MHKPRELVGPSAGERILASATSLFAMSGFTCVSTREIASVAQVNEVTIFRHYPRKHDLCLAAMKSGLQQLYLRGDLLAEIAEARDGRTALVRTFELIAKMLMEKPHILRLLQFGALELRADFEPLARKHLGELVEVTSRYLDPWIEKGELRCTNSKNLVFTFAAILLSYNSLQELFSGAGLSPDRMFEVYADFDSA